MTDKQALREVAEGVDRDEWEVLDNGDDEYQVIVSGSLESGAGYCSYQPVTNEISEQKIAAFIAAFNPATVQALLDELEADKEQIKTLESRNRRLEGIIDAAEKRIAENSGQKRLIGWRASDYTDETSDPELAKNWAAAIGVLPIFEGDVNTKLSAAGIGNNGGSNVT